MNIRIKIARRDQYGRLLAVSCFMSGYFEGIDNILWGSTGIYFFGLKSYTCNK